MPETIDATNLPFIHSKNSSNDTRLWALVPGDIKIYGLGGGSLTEIFRITNISSPDIQSLDC